MSDFNDILKRGKRVFDLKDKGGTWGRCEDCGKRSPLFPFEDSDGEIWMFCETCLLDFIKEETNENAKF